MPIQFHNDNVHFGHHGTLSFETSNRTRMIIQESEMVFQKLKVDRNSQKVKIVINGFINFPLVYKPPPIYKFQSYL